MSNMSFIRSITVRARFNAVSLLVTLSLVTLGLWSHLTTQRGIERVGTIFTQANKSSVAVGQLSEALARARYFEAAMISESVSNPAGVGTYRQQWKSELANAEKYGQLLSEANRGNEQIENLLAKQKKLLAEYAGVIDPIGEKLQNAVMEAGVALAYASAAEDTKRAMETNTVELRKVTDASVVELREQLDADLERASWLRLVLVSLVVALFVPLMWVTLRSVCGPLDEAVHVAHQIAEGKLCTAIPVVGQDEPARLAKAFLEMQQGLRELVGSVLDSAQNIDSASHEVAMGSLDLSQRTEQTATHIQAASSAMTQLSSALQHSAQSASTANHLASTAAQVARRGGEVVSDVVSTMNDIHSSSRKIADIIAVIDGIAFQTNILALNAAVEAARAGEQGRGFSVVAAEVRGLAQRSAVAAKEIKALISDSVAQVEHGSQLVKNAGSTMEEIVNSVLRVSQIIGEVTAATQQQSAEINQVSSAVTELDRMTQQNAALVEQSAAAADSLKDQSTNLTGLMKAFETSPTEPAEVQQSLVAM